MKYCNVCKHCKGYSVKEAECFHPENLIDLNWYSSSAKKALKPCWLLNEENDCPWFEV